MKRGAGRRTLLQLGERGAMVRVLATATRTRVQWYEQGSRRTRDFPLTPAGKQEAQDFAVGVMEGLRGQRKPQAPLTVAGLWVRYLEAERHVLRLKTVRLNTGHWREWEQFVGAETIANDVGSQQVAAFRSALERIPTSKGRMRATSSIYRAVRTVKRVYAWGEEHELVHDRVHRYRFRAAKNRQTKPVPQYSPDEAMRILAHVRLDWRRSWRPATVLTLCAKQGVRQWSVLHLQPQDVNVADRLITWQGEWDKTGKTWVQPLREESLIALGAALGWREELSYTGPWLIWQPTHPDRPYTAQALWFALRSAEKRAGVEHLRGRAAHGLRRMLAGEVYKITGDAWKAMRAIGDRDIEVMRSYLVDDDATVADAFRRLDQPPETVSETVIPEAPVERREEGHNGSD